jgi:LPXTG-motif cell wall-anchored protein
MKSFLTFCFLSLVFFAQAQIDSVRVVEPNRETSYTNEEVLLMSFAGLAILLAIYFLFKRRKKSQ